eukprot:542250-Hanusia_phi.AAC.3
MARKAKNARSKRALMAREAKVVEEERGALFMRGTSTNELINEILKDLVPRPPALPQTQRFAERPQEAQLELLPKTKRQATLRRRDISTVKCVSARSADKLFRSSFSA